MADKLIIDWKEYNQIVEKLAIQIHKSGFKQIIKTQQSCHFLRQKSFKVLDNFPESMETKKKLRLKNYKSCNVDNKVEYLTVVKIIF